MNDNLLIKLNIISAVIGVCLLVIISDKIDLPTSAISSISEKDINKAVKIKGAAKQILSKEKIAVIKIEDKTGEIDILAFNPNKLKIKKGSLLEIEGRISMYEDQLQIYAEQINIIN